MPTNWATNITFHDALTLHPRTLDELSKLVQRNPYVRVRGSGHSFNTIADSTQTVVILDQLQTEILVSRDRSIATVPAGMNYAQISQALHAEGLALSNLASLPHICIGGAVSTGTHGSGINNGALHTSITAINLVGADGALRRLEEGKDPEFYAAVVGLGSTGIATSFDVRVIPTFEIYQSVYGPVPHQLFQENLIDLLSGAYSVSFFTTWGETKSGEIWVKSTTCNPERYFDLPALTHKVHPIPGQESSACTDQLGIPGPWHLRLPHFRIDATPSAGNEQQSEFFVDAADAGAAFARISAISQKFRDHLLVSEIRAIASDNHWMSPAYGRTTIAFHFTWKNIPEIPTAVDYIEQALLPYLYRPHCGKIFTANSEYLQRALPRFDEFREYVSRTDPTGKFRNDFIKGILGL